MGEDADQAEVVEVLVRDDDPLEVLDAPAVRGQRPLERIERPSRVRAGVDQRQRVVLDHVAVHPPHGERRGDGQTVDPGLRGGREQIRAHRVKRQRASVRTERQPSAAVSFFPSSVARAL